jgi:beta-lactamase regulating signal transducer with metallopeptidase domain
MPTLLDALTYHRYSDSPTSMLVILVVRATLVLATGWLASRMLARSSAAVAHRVWLLTLAGSLVVPIVWALTPGWRVPLFAVHVQGETWCSAASAAPGSTPGWPSLLVALWIVGTTMGIGYTLLGVISARRLFRASLPCFDVEWLELLAQVQQETGVTRPVELRVTRRSMSPAVWCFRRVQILVPAVALDWPHRQRRSVLFHELAHVARQDCLWQMIANLTCAVWWFHPLAWLAADRLRSSSEVAADDFVITSGGGRVDYATQLLAVARALGSSRRLAVAQAMFHPSHLERRLRAILDPARPRGALDRRRSLAGLALASALVVPLSTFTPSAVRAVPPPEPVRVKMHFNVTVPAAPVAGPAAPLLVPQEVRTSEQAQRLLLLDGRLVEGGVQVPPQTPPAPPPVTTQVIPNWPVGQRAERLIPNYHEGMAQIVLVDQASAAAAGLPHEPSLAAHQVAPIASATPVPATGVVAYQPHTRLTE